MFLTLVRNLRLGDLAKRLQNGPEMTISEHHFCVAALGRGRSCAACASSLPRSTPGVWAIQMDEIQQPPALLAVRIRFRLFLTAGKRPATMRKNLPRGRLVVALDAPHSASITPRSAEPKPARIVHICPRAVSAAAIGVRIAAQGQGSIENYCWRPGRALRASQPGSGRAGGPRAASQKAFRMVPGRWAVPAVPTGSRLSSGRPAVTALVPLRNLLGHWPCLRRSRPGSAMTGR